MAFTMQQLDNIANARMDHFIKGQPLSQSIQNKPLMKALRAKQSYFPGGKGELKFNVKNDYDTEFMGYEHDDAVEYGNPANIKQCAFPYQEIHMGIKVTNSELKRDGITVVDTLNGENVSPVEGREVEAISNIFDDKMDDMQEGGERSFNDMCWRDGTQSPKVFAGILSMLSGTPTTGVVGGIDRATNSWWRNRATLAINASTASSQNLTKEIRSELRQLVRYGGKPALWLAGSDFLDALDAEVAEKGEYTQTGFAQGVDITQGSIKNRLGTFEYDPTLDDLGYAKYCFALDLRHIMLKCMSGEDMKKHSPARPPEKYVLYRAVTWTGTMIGRKLNANAVYSIA